ncbi:JmjC-domain-containing protein [Gonapodya prolifera JEL478]|uniref:JmjC-domain-containing protein n=1 Tax=Gonapodya prolifera (strain JEL478) TaxID=1344416 RepID=A0A139AUX5_GONPJ|nr:JmjC-domain-containing protein [Gonapodya prolifera JEL478]|eukprot:KXS20383.1 JmjC-domain-containing protein [Gonapodya prolifera JEL478]
MEEDDARDAGPFFADPPNLEPDSLRPSYFYHCESSLSPSENGSDGRYSLAESAHVDTLPPRKRQRFSRSSSNRSLALGAVHESDGIPVFIPTEDEFRDFSTLMRRIAPWGQQRGLVKIIPPASFLAYFPESGYPRLLKPISVKRPIVQQFHGTAGVYRCVNMEKGRSYAWDEWWNVAEETEDAKGELGEHTTKRNTGDGRRSKKKNDSGQTASSSPVESPNSNPRSPDSSKPTASTSTTATAPAHRVSSQRTLVRSPLPTPSALASLEHLYWRGLPFSPPLYGADQPGCLTFFLHGTPFSSWNCSRLGDRSSPGSPKGDPAEEGNLLLKVKRHLPGVNSPYLYAGAWRATFAWHVEDVDLCSINFVHFGQGKQWYTIPPVHREKFEQLARSNFPEDYRLCKEFLRHKDKVFHPDVLARAGVKCLKVAQAAGEIMVTYPHAYHSGFNLGPNLAESVNFAPPFWAPSGLSAQSCTCAADTVKIDVWGLVHGTIDEGGKAGYMGFDPKEMYGGRSMGRRPAKPKVHRREREELRWTDDERRCVLCPHPPTLGSSSTSSDPSQAPEFLPLADGTGWAHRLCAVHVPETAVVRVKVAKRVFEEVAVRRRQVILGEPGGLEERASDVLWPPEIGTVGCEVGDGEDHRAKRAVGFVGFDAWSDEAINGDGSMGPEENLKIEDTGSVSQSPPNKFVGTSGVDAALTTLSPDTTTYNLASSSSNPILLLTEALSRVEGKDDGSQAWKLEGSSIEALSHAPGVISTVSTKGKVRTKRQERIVFEWKEVVSGVELVAKDRWKLKCEICKRNPPPTFPSSHKPLYPGNGAPVQCVKGKCTRTYHPKCAQQSGMCLSETAEWSTFEDKISGRVWKEKIVTGRLYCTAHDPRREEERKAAKEKQVQDSIAKFQPGSRVWVIDSSGLLRAADPAVVLRALADPSQGCEVVCFESLESLENEDALIAWAAYGGVNANGDALPAPGEVEIKVRKVSWKHLWERSEGDAEWVFEESERKLAEERQREVVQELPPPSDAWKTESQIDVEDGEDDVMEENVVNGFRDRMARVAN